jgi:hypothetical protein
LALKVEVIGSSEMQLYTLTTRRYIPETAAFIIIAARTSNLIRYNVGKVHVVFSVPSIDGIEEYRLLGCDAVLFLCRILRSVIHLVVTANVCLSSLISFTLMTETIRSSET